MAQPIDSPTAFELVSARDGGDLPATYGGSDGPAGAEVTRRLGAQRGRPQGRVRHARPVRPARRRPRPPRRRASCSSATSTRTRPTLVTRNKLGRHARRRRRRTALGRRSAQTARRLPGPGRTPRSDAPSAGEFDTCTYYLWRRVADGPAAPTRRITGVVDVDDPAARRVRAVRSATTTSTGPCYGPLALPGGHSAAGAHRGRAALAQRGRHAGRVPRGPTLRPDPRRAGTSSTSS